MPLFLPPDPCFAEPADIAACRQLLSNGSKSFFAASFFLPRWIRQPASALYAFCRIADDAIDCVEDRAAGLAQLRERLDRVYAGRPMAHPVDRAFAGAVECFAMPRELPEALLEGFEWDADGRDYRDISGVLDYSARVAAAVGAMMAALMGVRSPEVLARACDLGSAMQLTNICRDVGEDARNGRIYLPLDWLREAGIEPEEFLADPVFSDALGSVIQRTLDLAETLYQRAESGIARLPVSCRPGIYAARLLYAEIGHEVARNGYDSVSRRAVVPAARKIGLLSQAVAVTPFPGGECDAPPLQENRFLVEAVAAAPVPAALRRGGRLAGPAAAPPRKRIGEKVVWVLDLLETLEQRDRLAAARNEDMLPALRNGG
ncbi:phytoene/squalene synthase family protein [Thiohalocapsa marina]|uniref:Phytoene/squalene synthase family protein n=1 Tax=Thiohalocapsa marina TaxID=424902 RepID=A0A5M8FQX7_9GAMM|nr:phytoene/squalene synthase family protein [Thiohalocapsa marina]KAA6186650.1 phytoene/squalene synthase family protein [Thiohalocapsa marina]